MNELVKYTPQKHLSKEEKTWGLLCHALSLCGLLVPLGNVIGPLIMWVIKKEESGFVKEEGKAAINFQLTVLIALLCCLPFTIVLIGFPLAVVIYIISVIFSILGAKQAYEGENYIYPFSLNFIK